MTRDELCAKREEALSAYEKLGPFVSCERYRSGHINDTFLVVSATGLRYIFQRINHEVFRKPDELMENIRAVTERIRERTGDERSTLCILPTDVGEPFYRDSIGSYWRMYAFVEGTVSCDRIESPEQFVACAKAFGHFQAQLADFDAASLYETIPDFHNTPKRYEALEAAIARDAVGRVASVQEEIAFVRARADFVTILEDARRAGELPLRVTHNDTKLNNILFDAVSGEPVCVIDLDTVMPGYSVTDFGDSIRFGANTAAEDEKDLSLVSLDLSLYHAYAEGFLAGCGGALTAREVELLPIGAMMMTLECGMRFLTDYLSGDTYFRISRPEHNLDRCRTQFALFADMERKLL